MVVYGREQCGRAQTTGRSLNEMTAIRVFTAFTLIWGRACDELLGEVMLLVRTALADPCRRSMPWSSLDKVGRVPQARVPQPYRKARPLPPFPTGRLAEPLTSLLQVSGLQSYYWVARI